MANGAPQNVMALLNEVENNMNPEERNGPLGKMLKSLGMSVIVMGSRISSAINFNSEINTTDNLLSMVNETTDDIKESMINAFTHQEKNSTSAWEKIWEKCSGCKNPTQLLEDVNNDKIKNLENLRKSYIDGINKTRMEMANNYLRTASISSAIIILTETVRLIQIWNCVKRAKNLMSAREEQSKIEQLISSIKVKISDLTELQNQFNKGNENKGNENTGIENTGNENKGNEKSKKRILRRIDDGLIDLRTQIVQVRSLIGDLKISINGKIERLSSHSEHLAISTISSAAHLILNGFQIYTGFGAASVFWKGLSSLAFAGLTAVTVVGAGTYIVTENTIKELRKCLVELRGFEKELEKVDNEARKVRNWLTDIQDEMDNKEISQTT